MSGGSHNYQFYHLNDYVESMKKYDPELASLMEDVVNLCHDIEWFESGDYSYGDLEISMEDFRTKWMVATPEVQESVKKAILKYCDSIDRYCTELRNSLDDGYKVQ